MFTSHSQVATEIESIDCFSLIDKDERHARTKKSTEEKRRLSIYVCERKRLETR